MKLKIKGCYNTIFTLKSLIIKNIVLDYSYFGVVKKTKVCEKVRAGSWYCLFTNFLFGRPEIKLRLVWSKFLHKTLYTQKNDLLQPNLMLYSKLLLNS